MALCFFETLALTENCLVNNCLIMIGAYANICLSKLIDAGWYERYLTSRPVARDQKLTCAIKMIFVQNS